MKLNAGLEPIIDLSHQKTYLIDEKVLSCGVCGWKGNIAFGAENVPEAAHAEYEQHVEGEDYG